MVYSEKKCAQCGRVFTPTSSVSRFCSWQCRFQSMIPVAADDEVCWEWPLSRNKQTGYGQFMVSAKPMVLETAHRISFQLKNGSLVEGEVVRHNCDNRSCFNPSHLQKGTHTENHEDMISRKRHRYGERHRNAKLKDSDVLAIRNSTENPTNLAKEYHVTRHAIYQVLKRKSWKHI